MLGHISRCYHDRIFAKCEWLNYVGQRWRRFCTPGWPRSARYDRVGQTNIPAQKRVCQHVRSHRQDVNTTTPPDPPDKENIDTTQCTQLAQPRGLNRAN